MIEVKFTFLSSLMDITKRREIDFTINEKSTIRSALERLRSELGNNFEKSIFTSSGRLNSFILILLNGKDIRHLNGLNTNIKNGDEISMIPAVAGG